MNCEFTELQERNEESRNLRIRLENLRSENEKLLLEKEQLEKRVTELRALNDADSEGANKVAGCVRMFSTFAYLVHPSSQCYTFNNV